MVLKIWVPVIAVATSLILQGVVAQQQQQQPQQNMLNITMSLAARAPAQFLLENCNIAAGINSPTAVSGGPTNVSVIFTVDRLLSINSVMETMSVNLMIDIKWRVECVRNLYSSSDWPQMVGSIDHMPSDALWFPIFFHRNSVDGVNLEIDSYNKDFSVMMKTGIFTRRYIGIFNSYCDFDFYYFPFDTQRCGMEFLTCGSRTLVIEMTKILPSTNVRVSPRNSDWSLVSTRSHHNFTRADEAGATGCLSVVLELEVERSSTYYLLNLLLPFALLNLLELSIFLIPPTTPERAMFSATIVLALFVLDIEVLSNVPKTPQTIIVANYMSIVLIFAIVCTLYSAVICSWFYYSPKTAEKRIKCCCKMQLSTLVDFCFVIIALGSLASLYAYVVPHVKFT